MQLAPRLAGGGGAWQRRRLLPSQAQPSLAGQRQQQPGRLGRVRRRAAQTEQEQQQHGQQLEAQPATLGSSGGEAPAATVAAAAAAAGLVGAQPGSLGSGAEAPLAEVPLPTSSNMEVAVGGTAATIAGSPSSPSSGGSGGAAVADEPELALVLMACGIGLATGAAIVGFNVGVHEIRDWVWQGQPLLSSSREVLRGIAESELWPRVVFPPFLGGLAVGALGLLIGGYDDLPPPRVGDSGGSSGSSGSAAKQQGAAGSAGSSGSGSGGSGSSGAGAPAVLGSMSASGSAAAAAAVAPSSSLAIEQWKLQAVLRPVSRALAAVVTLGSGASLGPEGPSVDIGKSFAKGFASNLRSKQRHLTSFMAAGAGAGVAAGFNAPIAGVFFAVETVLQKQKLPRSPSGGDLQSQVSSTVSSLQPSGLTVAMVLLASVLAAVVSQAGLGSSPAFRVPEYRLESLAELPLYLAFGAICGVVSASFSFSTRVATDAFDELRQQNRLEAALMPCIGGLTTGVLALGYPEILYQGFDNVNNILSSNGAYAPGLLIQIVVMKVIATSICRGSGLQGGLYAPSIFIGASLGTAFGLMAHAVGDPLGMTLAAPQAYALVGVAAMLASNCSVPLTSVLLLFELTRDYLIILPTMAAVGISFWISSLAAPSVKNAAAARRMSAAAAASAAVATTQLDPKATEAMLVGSLQQQGKLSSTATVGAAAAGAAAAHQPAAHQAGAAPAAPAVPAGERHSGAAASSAGAAGLGSSASFDGFDAPSAAASKAAAKLGTQHGPVQLAAEAARGGQELLVSAALERSCLLVEAEMPVARALALMQADDQHVAVVLGEDGGVMGLVTRDVLEQCVEAAEAEAAPPGSSSSSSEGEGEGGGSGSGGGAGGRRSRAGAKSRDVAVWAEAAGPAAASPAAAAASSPAAAGKAASAAPVPLAAPLRSVNQD